MGRGKVLLTSPLPVDVRPLLGGAEVELAPVGPALDAALPGADALMCLLSDRIDAALLARAPRLRVVANYAVGYDNIDVGEATRRGVVVVNTRGVLTDATADLTMALLLGFVRRLAEGEALVREGRWTGWASAQLLGGDFAGKRLGLVGFGRIGRAVARRAVGFGLEIVYSGPRRAPEAEEAAVGARHVEMGELLATSDYVSIHCPLSEATRGLVGAAELAAMKPGAVLVNTARGAIVDEDALAAALERGHLGGAALDVYSEEPGVPARLLAAPRTLLLPHVGSATRGTRQKMAELAAHGVAEVLAGRRPANVVNPAVWA